MSLSLECKPSRQCERHNGVGRHDRYVLLAVHRVRDGTGPDAPARSVFEQLLARACVEGVEVAGIASLENQIARRCEIPRAADARARWMLILPDEISRGRVVSGN